MINIAKLVSSIGFQIDKQSVRDVNVALNQIERRVTTLRRNLGKKLSLGNMSTGALRNDLRAINTSLGNMHRTMGNGVSRINNYTTAMNNLAAALGNVRSNMPSLPRVPNGNFGGFTHNSNQGGRRRPGGFAGLVGGLVGSPMGLAAAFVPGVGLGWGLRETIVSGRQMQSTQLAYQALMGKEGGNKQYQDILNMSRNMKMDFGHTADLFKGLLASSVNVEGLGKTKEERAGKAQDIFRGVTSYGLALGLDDEQMKGSLRAIQQMMDKGQVYSEELRQQLAERMPGAVQILAKSMGVPVEQLYQMLKDGKVISSEVLPKMAAEMEKIANDSGAMSQYLTSSLAAQRAFKTELMVVIDKIWKGGADEGLAKFFGMLLKVLNALEPLAGSLGKGINLFFDRLSLAVETVLWPINGLVDLFGRLHWTLQSMVVGGAGFVLLLMSWVRVLKILNFVAKTAFLPFLALYLLLEDIYVWTKDGDSLFGEMFGAFENFSLWLGDNFFKPWDDFFKGVQAARDAILDMLPGSRKANAENDPGILYAKTDPNTGLPVVDSAGKPSIGRFKKNEDWEELRQRMMDNEKRLNLKPSEEWQKPRWDKLSQTNNIRIEINATGINGTAEALRQEIAAVVTSFPGGVVS